MMRKLKVEIHRSDEVDKISKHVRAFRVWFSLFNKRRFGIFIAQPQTELIEVGFLVN